MFVLLWFFLNFLLLIFAFFGKIIHRKCPALYKFQATGLFHIQSVKDIVAKDLRCVTGHGRD